MNLRRNGVDCADTIYFGGGTPSILTVRQLERILDQAYRCFSVKNDAEVTLEVNPGTVNKRELSAYRSLGINRLNIGLQSINEKTLRFLGRIHSAKQGSEMYQWSRDVGFENVGVDLIYGVPEQNLRQWEVELAAVVKMVPDHLSCYTLTLEADTPMANWVAGGKALLPDEEMIGNLFSFTSAFLKQNQYDPYEISNFALVDVDGWFDRRSRHNQKYWNGVAYMGFGPAAHSYQEDTRWWNHRSLAAYIADLRAEKVPVSDMETLDREQKMIEFIFLGLRQKKGIDVTDFSLRFEIGFHEIFGPVLRQLLDEKLMLSDSSHVRLTEKGLRFHENVVGRLLG
jgi:oxygen-independent coproporphyrinogen-3 oxidase